MRMIDLNNTPTGTEAIINPANEALSHGAGVAAILDKLCGPSLTKKSNEIM